jgi:hypothetical protein
MTYYFRKWFTAKRGAVLQSVAQWFDPSV